MSTFKRGDTIVKTSISGHETYGYVIDVYTHNGREKVKAIIGPNVPAYTYDATEIRLHILQSPDHVVVKDDDGRLWSFEVLDHTADMSQIIVKYNGAFYRCPVERIVSITPAAKMESAS